MNALAFHMRASRLIFLLAGLVLLANSGTAQAEKEAAVQAHSKQASPFFYDLYVVKAYRTA